MINSYTFFGSVLIINYLFGKRKKTSVLTPNTKGL
jgi:hypothetical protein